MNYLEDLAEELLQLWRTAASDSREKVIEGPVSDTFPNAYSELRGRAEAIIEAIYAGLQDGSREAQTHFSDSDVVWSFGPIQQSARPRQILRGFLEPVREIDLVESVLPTVAQFLRVILPNGDSILREQHGGVGWHYHYLDRRMRRSDTILSFDTRWTTPPSASPCMRPLFAEKHGEARAKFAARPERWNDEKCLSVHVACAQDLSRPIQQFRCAKNEAIAIWPRAALLTPRPAS